MIGAVSTENTEKLPKLPKFFRSLCQTHGVNKLGKWGIYWVKEMVSATTQFKAVHYLGLLIDNEHRYKMNKKIEIR